MAERGSLAAAQERDHMKANVSLTITSLLSILFMTLHLADDIVRGFERGWVALVFAVPVLVFWLYATLELAGRRSGYVIIFLGSLLGAVVPVVHMKSNRFGEIAATSGGLLFVFTLLALGVTSLFSLALSVRGLWRPRGGESR
jgi:hypothetical protein